MNLGAASSSSAGGVAVIGTTGLELDLDGMNRDSPECRLVSRDDDLEPGGEPSASRFCSREIWREDRDDSEFLEVRELGNTLSAMAVKELRWLCNRLLLRRPAVRSSPPLPFPPSSGGVVISVSISRAELAIFPSPRPALSFPWGVEAPWPICEVRLIVGFWSVESRIGRPRCEVCIGRGVSR